MDSVGDIMERLGFNKDGDDSTKAAFIKNLIKQAYGVEVEVPPMYRQGSAAHESEELEFEQLCFPFLKRSSK